MNCAQASQVVEERALVGGVEILADVEAEDASAPRPEPGAADVGDKCVDAAVVEAETVDQCFRFRQTEQSWPRVPRLGAWRHRTAFDEAEPQRRETVDVGRILVQPGGEPDPVRELETHSLDW